MNCSYNETFINDLNQILHNSGIIFEKRIDIIVSLIKYKFNNDESINSINLNEKLLNKLILLITKISISKREIFQKIFMYYGNNYLKKELDQFYTPITIGEFLSKLSINNKKALDPACGTGDLIINYNGNKTLWDISNEVIELVNINYKFQDILAEIINQDSLLNNEIDNDLYDYVFLNPPFGSSTIISDEKILKKYKLSKNKKKEEIGILFIERGLNLLNENGIAFIIVPNGYLGNTTKKYIELRKYLLKYKIIAILQLPSNTFSRSGTGVSTSIIIISKQQSNKDDKIFIYDIKEIGYQLNKKNTPFKYKKEKNELILDDLKKPILLTDYADCFNKFSKFIKDNNIKNLNYNENILDIKYDYINTSNLDKNIILDINRYLSPYNDILIKYKNEKKIKNFIKSDENYKINKDKEYLYLDIKQINTPLYNSTNKIFGFNLPSRAKIKLQMNDIIVSRLKGKLSFTIILDDSDNIICTNGFCLLRPKNFKDLIIIFGNLFTHEFKIQRNSLCTGSIMETITNEDIFNIKIKEDIDYIKYENIYNALKIIKEEI